MKKIRVLLLLGVSSTMASGQVTYGDSREDFLIALQNNRNFRTCIASNNIASAQSFAYKNTIKDGSLVNEARYDKRGNNTDWLMYKHGKVKIHNKVTFDDSNRVTSFAFYKGTDRLKKMSTDTYDKSGNLVEIDRYKHNPQTFISKTIRTYDSRNNIMESKVLDNKGALKSRVEYTYYPDGSKKQTIQYSGKGKVKRIWNFDCNPVGVQEAKNFKDTSKICVRYETDKDGNPTKIKEEYTNSGSLFGGTVRSVTKYDKNNNMLDETEYKLNGNEIYHWSASYNTSGKIAEHITFKGKRQKPWLRTTYTYNNEGTIDETATYWKAEVSPFYKMKYVYTTTVASAK